MFYYHVHFKKSTFVFENIEDARHAKDVLPLIGAGAYQGCDCQQSLSIDNMAKNYVKVEL